MIQKIKNKLLILGTLLTLAVPMAVPAVAYGLTPIQQQVCNGVNLQTDPTKQENCSKGAATSDFQTTLTDIINIISIIVGVVAVIMIIYGGFRYITSGGQQEGVKNAKNTILYGLIGLVIVALAQIIVKFVLTKASGA